MFWKAVSVLALVSIAACQAQSNVPTAELTLRGQYKALADCFYLSVKQEGHWKIEDLTSLNTSRVILGTEQMEVGRVDFLGTSPTETRVTFLIAHPEKVTERARACASG